MIVQLSAMVRGVNQRGVLVSVRARMLALVASMFLVLLIGGCAVSWVGNYDKESIDRTTEISKSVLKLYQDLIATEPSKRTTAMSGAFSATHNDVESMMRLHLLREQARRMNNDSAKIAGDLLDSWKAFSTNHRSTDSMALTDIQLNIERGILERHLRAAFVAEEAKKLVTGAT
jgi:hypothetical protein